VTGTTLWAWARPRLLDAVRVLPLAALAYAANIALFVLSVLAFAFTPLFGIGVLAFPAVTSLVRKLANLHRRLSGEWAGVPVPQPYRSPPEAGPWLAFRRYGWVVRDPATWRELLWLLAGLPVSLALALVPASLVAYGALGMLLVPVLIRSTGVPWGYGPTWPIENAFQAVLVFPEGVLATAAGLALAPRFLRLHVLFHRVFLARTRTAALTQRVEHLAATRADTVETQTAELRRIERDLHDGAQARLVALTMHVGLAEELMGTDPQAAQQLLAQARETGGQALAELRDLVRGIFPPVLAERGLPGGVRALALTLAVPVEVGVDLPGRLPAPIESAAYFAVAEALANVAKHSHATRAWVDLRYTDGALRVAVRDDGAGGADPAAGTGLRGIGRRLAAFDGTITMVSPPGGPTVVSMELPCELSSPRTTPSSGTA
jgi:signal transduction histidine kinase